MGQVAVPAWLLVALSLLLAGLGSLGWLLFRMKNEGGFLPRFKQQLSNCLDTIGSPRTPSIERHWPKLSLT